MISKRILGRADGQSSALNALKYGAGLKVDRNTGKYLDKSHRTRLGGFGLVENGVYSNQDIEVLAGIVDLAGLEMQATCDLNSRVGVDKKLAHFVVSFNQDRPNEAVLRDTEDSMLSAMSLSRNHFATFLHSDNGYWHLHIFASRIEREVPHRGNPLWHDRIKRDKVCREIETRHGLRRDNGLHKVDTFGQIIEIPRDERRAKREAKPKEISDRAKTTENYSGEKSFQAWANEIRIGDRLKHTTGWQDMHSAAAVYCCEIKQKGAGFIICPAGDKGGMQLSKVGLNNLVAKFGAFEPANPVSSQHQGKREQKYKPEPTKQAGPHFDKWREAKLGHQSKRLDALAEFRKAASLKRFEIRARQRAELANIRSSNTGIARVHAISVVKMQHAAELAELADATRIKRSTLYKSLTNESPGATFRDYLVQQAQAGDDTALALIKRFGMNEATKVSRQAEVVRLKIVAAFSGSHDKPLQRLPIKHHVERNGTVIFDLGRGRTITDSSIARQIQLNTSAANDPLAIEISLRFAVSRFGSTLTLTGSAEFQRLAVETSVRKGLFITFTDPTLERYKQQLTTPINPTFTQENTHANHHRKPNRQKVAAARSRVPDMFKRTMDGIQKRSEMLLPRDDGIHVRNRDERQTDSAELRRPNSGITTSPGLWPAVISHDQGACGKGAGAELHSDRRITAAMETKQVHEQQADVHLTCSSRITPNDASEQTTSTQAPDGYKPASSSQQCGGKEPWALVLMDGEYWITHKSGRSEWMAHRLSDFTGEQQATIRTASTSGHAIKFKTGKDRKPIVGSLRIGKEATQNKPVVER